MDILVAIKGSDTAAWMRSIAAIMPAARVRIWSPGDKERADYIFYWKESPESLAERDGVKAVFNMGAGVDALMKVAQEDISLLVHKVPVVRLEDAGMAEQMVQYALYCALRYQRRFDEYEVQARKGEWKPLDVHSKEDFVVGVLGAGQLGSPVAKALVQMGFTVRVYSRSAKNIEGVTTYAGSENLEAFATGCMLLVNLLPNTPETEGILSSQIFSKMTKGSFLVNLARGTHLVDDDLLFALNTGQLQRAALDVFRSEPLPKDHLFWRHPGVEPTPHISARTLIRESVEQIADKIARHNNGEALSGLDFHRGY